LRIVICELFRRKGNTPPPPPLRRRISLDVFGGGGDVKKRIKDAKAKER
jgi:hypothetical protein